MKRGGSFIEGRARDYSLDGPLRFRVRVHYISGFEHGDEEVGAVLEEHFFKCELDIASGHDVSGLVVAVDGVWAVDAQNLDGGDEFE